VFQYAACRYEFLRLGFTAVFIEVFEGMKLLSIFVLCSLPSCAHEPLTEMEKIIKEYEYQEELAEFRMAVQLCYDKGGYLFMDNPVKRYKHGIENAERPDIHDIRWTQCHVRGPF